MPLLPLLVAMLAGTVDLAPPVQLGGQLAAVGRIGAGRDLVGPARAALKQRDFARAALWAALAEARTPADPEAPLVAGMARFRAGQAAEAIVPFQRAVARAPAAATARFDLGSALYASGRFAEAEASYLAAAALDAQLLPLATMNAGLAALDGGDDERAQRHFAAAEKAARARGQTPVAERAATFAATTRLAERAIHGPGARFPAATESRAGAASAAGPASTAGAASAASPASPGSPSASPRVHELAHAARAALQSRRWSDAAAGYRAAAALAAAERAPAAERAELDIGLGHALYRAGDLTGAARAFDAALAHLSGDAELRFMLGLVHFDAGADRDARLALERALALGLPADEARRARDILRGLGGAHRSESSRFYLDASAGAGYDSNVPQSGVILTANAGAAPRSDAAYAAAELDIFWRPLGDARRGLSLDYRLGQLAYLSSVLDPYSLQEHDLALAGAWTPTARLTLEAGAEGYVMFAGVRTFEPFQAGASLGPRLVVREGRGFESRLRYQHVFKVSLDRDYAYLGGQRDEAGISEVWRDPRDRVSLGYVFTREAIGVERALVGDLLFPMAPGLDPASVYVIPYGYIGHELALIGARDLPWVLRGTVAVRYEHRDYDGTSYIEPASGTPARVGEHARRDDRVSVDATLRRGLGAGFDVEVAYTFIANRSTIDDSSPRTPLDYDDKNYVKHVVQLAFGFVY